MGSMDAPSPGGAASAYSAAFLDHLTHPRRAGRLASPTHRAEVEDGVCGDRLTLELVVADGVVADAGFRVQGCPGAIAVGSALAAALVGRPARPGAVSSAELEAALCGVPPAKRHALRLATDALAAALRTPVALS